MARRVQGRLVPPRRMLGVLGGMGPAATVDFYSKLVKATPASRDQEHIPVLIAADPRIDDRSEAIKTGRGDVLSGMLIGLRHLDRAGVEAIAIPCNTAHHWLPELQVHTRTPFISLIEAAAREARRHNPSATRALVAGTIGTIKSHLYDSELRRLGFEVAPVIRRDQEQVERVISCVKAGKMQAAAAAFLKAAPTWCERADVVLLACTELPLAMPLEFSREGRFVDSTAALARACVEWATSDTSGPIADRLRGRVST